MFYDTIIYFSKFLPDFLKDDEKQNKNDFTRKRKLSLPIVIMILFNLVKDRNTKGYEITMNQFWSECKRFKIGIVDGGYPPSKSALTQARKKIKPKFFKKILMNSALQFETKYKEKYLWKGLRVIACDGSKYTLPASKDLIKSFGRQNCGKVDAHYPQALVSLLFNVRSKIVYDVNIEKCKGNERKDFLKLSNLLNINDLVILDRGYPSYEVIKELMEKNIDFLIRMPVGNSFKIIDDFKNSNKIDAIYELEISKWKKIKVRLLKIELPNGEQRIFITSLLDKKKYSHKEMTDLYYERWEIEIQYYKNKYLFYVENFHSKNSDGIKQEIYAQLFLSNLTRIVINDAEIDDIDEVEKDDEPAFKNAVYTVERYFNEIILRKDKNIIKDLYQDILKEVKRIRYKKRKGRKLPRRSYKPISKWRAKTSLT